VQQQRIHSQHEQSGQSQAGHWPLASARQLRQDVHRAHDGRTDDRRGWAHKQHKRQKHKQASAQAEPPMDQSGGCDKPCLEEDADIVARDHDDVRQPGHAERLGEVFRESVVHAKQNTLQEARLRVRQDLLDALAQERANARKCAQDPAAAIAGQYLDLGATHRGSDTLSGQVLAIVKAF